MRKVNEDPLEKLFEQKFKDYKPEVKKDLLSGVQSRFRFDHYVHQTLTTLGTTALIGIPLAFVYYLNQSPEPPKEEQNTTTLLLENIEHKNFDQKIMPLETVSLNIDRVAVPAAAKISRAYRRDETPVPISPNPKAKEEMEEKPIQTIKADPVEYTYTRANPVEGFEELYRYIESTLQYPDTLKEERIVGTVRVKFAINKLGSVENVSVDQGLHELLDREALRVIEGMPRWNPALVNGAPIRSEMTIPITFNLEDNTEDQ